MSVILRQVAGLALLPIITSFPLTENPINESNRWVGGLTVGLDWQNLRSTGGACYSSVFNPSDVDDCIACANPAIYTTFTPNQYARGIVKRSGGYNPTDNHEIELHVRCTITAHSITTMEYLTNTGGSNQGMRWDGAINDITPMTTAGPGTGALANGDEVLFTVVGNVFKIYKNTVEVDSWTDSTRTNGTPGMACFVRPGDTVLLNYGWDLIELGNLV